MVKQKKRHGCLTTWLIFMIIGNSISTLIYLLGSQIIRQTFPTLPDWACPLLGFIGVFNVVCTIALLKWQKWGFWGFLGSSITAFVVNISLGIGIGQALSGFMGIVCLYVVFNLGKENKGWSQLE